jgi:predicted ATPase
MRAAIVPVHARVATLQARTRKSRTSRHPASFTSCHGASAGLCCPMYIRTPDQRLRVFVSSTLTELTAERRAVRAAVERVGLTPVMFELGARPHAPQELYRAYLEQSDVFVGVYWQSYGWIGPAMAISGLEDEYRRAEGKPRLLYVKEPAPTRDPRLAALIERIEQEALGSYRVISGAEELGALVRDDLAVLLSERFADSAGPAAPDQVSARHRGGLPAATTSFVGREAEEEELAGRLVHPDIRLVTLTGPGGIGKTRLAIAVAERVAGAFPGGVAFVPLASVRDPSMLMPSIASGVGAPVDHRRAALDALAQAFDGPGTLLVLDNLEQVVEGAPELSELLARCPTLTVLATSRTVLRLRAEHEYRVPPLETGPSHTIDQLAGGTSSPAVRLFDDRARAVRSDLVLDDDDALAVAEICRRLDGLPLAIELAAARVRLLPPQALLQRLGSRLEALGTGPADLPARQRTLRATIEWSRELLDVETARRLDALAVFVGGWTLEAAASVWGVDESDALDTLDRLVGHSLLVASIVDGGPRFDLLETIRELLRERLMTGGDRESLQARHAAHYRALVGRADVPMRTDGQSSWRRRLEREHGNIRAATRWILDREDLPTAATFLRQQFFHWWLNDHLLEGWSWLCEALARSADADARSRAELNACAGIVAMELGVDEPARGFVVAATAALREIDDPFLHALTLLLHAWLPPTRTTPLTEVIRYLDEAIAVMEDNDESFMLGMALTSRGLNRFLLSQHDLAITEQRRALELGRDLGNGRLQAQATSLLGVTLIATGDREEGLACLREGAAWHLEVDDSEGVALCLSMCATVASQLGNPEKAAVLLGAADEQRRQAGLRVWPTLRPTLEATTEEIAAELGAQRFAARAAEGAALSRRDALAEAVSMSEWARPPTSSATAAQPEPGGSGATT